LFVSNGEEDAGGRKKEAEGCEVEAEDRQEVDVIGVFAPPSQKTSKVLYKPVVVIEALLTRTCWANTHYFLRRPHKYKRLLCLPRFVRTN
jgi:hypothetical protein